MPDLKKNSTKEEATAFVKSLRQVSEFVRILSKDEIEGKHPLTADFKQSYCYRALKKDSACENCISKIVLENKSDSTKIEFINGQCYQFFAQYIIVEGVECSIETAVKINEKVLVDSIGYKEIVEKYSATYASMYTDPLTGVYNRAYYEKVEKNVNTPAGIAVIDIDDFKLCNDIYGHKAGDVALQTVTQIIRNNIRSNDKIIRIGGDEILLILDGIQEESFERKLERIRSQVRMARVKGYNKLQLSISIGAVVSMTETREVSVTKADRLMYIAKSSKNRVVSEWNENKQITSSLNERDDNKPLVLVVDDSDMNRFLLSQILLDDYNVIEACDGVEATQIIQDHFKELSIVLLDIVMPRMDGFGVLEFMNANDLIQDLPVIMISSMDEDSAIRRCYELGISDYVRRPFSADVVGKRVYNIVRLYQRQRNLQREIREQVEEREKNSRVVTSIISHVVENRNGESGPHVIHVEQITEIILNRLTELTDMYKLSKEDKKQISLASALHDIGKIGIDEKILNKPGKLTEEEYEIMKTHTTIGAIMIHQVKMEEDDTLIQFAYEICRWHHEKWDGRGYPDGLKRNYIPISAQVVSIADVYDALVSERVYKKAYSHEKAIEMIINGECGEFNPLLIQCLKDCSDRIQLVESKNSRNRVR
jgi:putative two-component system response regulator